MDVNEELCIYLKQKEFKEFMNLWRHQYERLGRCGGTISLPLRDDNRDKIASFMGKDYHKNTHARITYTQLMKVIHETRFAGADFNQVLLMYYSNEVITHRDAKSRKENEAAQFFAFLMQEDHSLPSQIWLKCVVDTRSSVYVRIVQEYRKHPSSCPSQLRNVLHAIDHLPVWKHGKENIAVFASKFMDDPHAFDRNKFAFYLLFQAICFHMGYKKDKYNGIEQNEILYKAGLYRDSISNFCVLARLNAVMENGDMHPGWKGFFDNYEAFNMNMDNLSCISGIDKKTCRQVFIVENPSIFQALLQQVKSCAYEEIGLICTNGQLNVSGYLLLDKIHEADIAMYYAGDMDPEGILIADKLKTRYGDALTLWRYDIDDYEKCISKQMASKRRMFMLEQIGNQTLRKLAEYMQMIDGAVGYQENLLKEYLSDIVEFASKKD